MLPVARRSQFEGDVPVKALRHRLSLQPQIVSPPLRHRSGSLMPSLSSLSLVLLVASTVALAVALLTLPSTRSVFLKTEGDPATTAALQLASVPNAAQLSPRLIGVESRWTFVNEALELGISLNRASGSEFALLAGLAPGTRLSAGHPFGQNGWRLPARELASVLTYAPKDFVGVMNVAIDLRMPADRLVDSRVLRLEWVARQPEVQAKAQRPERDESKVSVVVSRAANREEAAALLKRGQDYLRTGDIASARLVLRRAVGMGNTQAVLALGASFDPVVLNELGVLGVVPDVAQARFWYQRAADAGLIEASQRLDRLANMVR